MAYTEVVEFYGESRGGDVITQQLAQTADTNTPDQKMPNQFWFGSYPWQIGNSWRDSWSNRRDLYVSIGDRSISGGGYSADFANAEYVAVRYSFGSSDYRFENQYMFRKETTTGTGVLADAYIVPEVKNTRPQRANQSFYENLQTPANVQWSIINQDIYDVGAEWDLDRPFGSRLEPLSVFAELVALPSILMAGTISLVTGNANLAVIRCRLIPEIEDYTFCRLQDIDYLIQSITIADRRRMELVLVVNP